MPSTIRCEVEFIEPQTKKKFSIIGLVGISQLFEKNSSWITVENKVQKDKNWISVNSLIYKPDIEKITFLSPVCYISVDKKDLSVHKSLLSEPIKD
jgi:hypothetical protein